MQAICSKARDCLWSGYASRELGGVATTLIAGALDSEAFFAREHYSDWLQWIRSHSQTDTAARHLANWLDKEEEAIDVFARDLVTAQQRSSAPEDTQLTVLDAGCGFGRHIEQLLECSDRVEALGVDINPPKINEAMRSAHAHRLWRRVTYLVDDIAKLRDLQDAEIDFAICMTNTLGNLAPKKQPQFISRLAEVLKPGGRVLFSVYSPDSVPDRLVSYKAIGLDVIERGRRIVAAEGLQSEFFEEARLRNLLERNGLELVGGIEKMSSIAWQVVARRPDRPAGS
jgi:SAM-dependent methyltransferase